MGNEKTKKKTRIRLPRSKDPKLDSLARSIEKRIGRVLKQNPYNPLRKVPKIHFLALTETTSWDDEMTGRDGAITAAHAKLDYPETSVYCELHVGTDAGTGVSYVIRGSPAINGVYQLERIVNAIVKDAIREGMEDYYERLGQGVNLKDITVVKAKPVKTHKSIYELKRSDHNVDNLHKIIKECSKILSGVGSMVHNEVKIYVTDRVRRHANSEGTMILDPSWGIHIHFGLEFEDSKGMHWPVYQSFNFAGTKIAVEEMEKAARRFKKLVTERIDCEIAAPYYGPVLLEPTIMASELHEAIVHFAASDVVLAHSTPMGIESFGKKVAPEELTIISHPNHPSFRWGCYLYDQEGVIPQKVFIIEDGVHKGFLADRHGAQLLTEVLGVDIPAGNSMTSIQASGNNFELFDPQPRISYIDATWKGERRYNRTELKKLFIKMLREKGLKEGLVVKEFGAPGYCQENGETHVFYWAPYMMDLKGNLRPVKPMMSVNTSRHVLENIVAMTYRKEHVAHHCGDDIEQAMVRAGITCGAGIIDNLTVIPEKSERYGKLFGRGKPPSKDVRNRHW